MKSIKVICKQIYFYLCVFWYTLTGVIMNRSFNSGCLEVVDKGEVIIELTEKYPRYVKVYFSSLPNCIPCNQHHDKLCYEIINKFNKFWLVIKWDITDTRSIKWSLHN